MYVVSRQLFINCPAFGVFLEMMRRLGHKLTTYENLDGRRLVSYQCVVIRSEWEKVKPYFWEALVEFVSFCCCWSIRRAIQQVIRLNNIS